MAKELIHTLFAQKANEVPNQIALSKSNDSITYLDLSSSSNQLSNLLRALDLVPGDVVGTLLSSGFDLVRSVLGIMQLGGVYMPMDEGYSNRRLVQMLQESKAKILIITRGERLYAKALLESCEHNVTHLLEFPGVVSELMGEIKVEGLDMISSAGLKVFGLEEGAYVQMDLSLEEQPISNPKVEVGFDSPSYIYYTSGSSGRSKGIIGSYGSLSHYVQWHSKEWNEGVEKRVAQLCSPGFDAWFKDVLPTLISGGTVCIAPNEIRSNMALLVEWLTDSKVTHLQTVPSIFRLLTASLKIEDVKLSYLEQVILAGEPLYGQDVLNWYEVQGQKTNLANMYGLTETTILKSYYRITSGDWSSGDVIPVGEPISNTRIAIINDGGICLNGEIGEIYIKSPYVTLGYLDPKLNSGLFVQNPLSSEEDIICRTGDIGRFNEAGHLEVLGREDDQVKVHGVRIELSEVRSALNELRGIERVDLMVHQSEDNNRELLCYYTGDAQDTEHLRKALGELLPSIYLPGHFIWLESFPLTLNGKVDRKKLPRPDLLLASESFEEPEGELEIGLARLWGKVLGRNEIGRQDSFFKLGGSSLKVIQLISWVYKEYEVQLAIGDIFDNPEFSSQAELIRGATRTLYKAIEKVTEQDNYALSPSQLRTWLQEQRDNDALPFNSLMFMRFTGKLDYNSLERSFETLLERHESLRTVFIQEEGTIRQKIVPLDSFGFKVEFHDLSDDLNPEASARAMGNNVRLKRFNLSEGPMLRVELYRIDDDSHLLMMCSHHIINDDWSLQLQSRELITLYNSYNQGESNPLIPLGIQYKDYAAWQLSMLSGSELERHRSYWMGQFSDEVPSLSLPSDRPRPEVPTFRGAEYRFMLSAEQSNGIKELIEKQGATLFMGLNAFMVTLLYRYTGRKDIVIGAPVAGRDHPDLEDQIGLYLNTLALRYCFEPQEDFLSLLTKVKQRVLDGFEHQVYPFDYLISELGLDTEVNRSPLFDVAVILQNVDLNLSEGDLELEGLKAEVLSEDVSGAKGDMSFQFIEGEQGLNCIIEYATDLYDQDRIKRLESDFVRLLDEILSDPSVPLSDLDYISLEEQKAGQGFNQVLHIEEQTSIPSLLKDSFSAHRNLAAVVAGDKSISYEDLSSSSNRLSHLLLKLNFKPGDVAGTLLTSGIDLVSSVLGIMHLGGVYMPMDEGYSDRRLGQMLAESGTKILITTVRDRLYIQELLKSCEHSIRHLVVFPGEVSELMEGLNVEGLDLIGASSANVEVVSVEEGKYIQLDLSLEDQPASDPEVEVGFDSPGYIYYTSGSSGRSKGIKGSYQSLSHYVQWHAKEWGLGEESRVAQLCSPGFDAWLKDVLPTLISGGTVWITSNDIRSNTGLLSEWLIDSGVTHLQTVPSIFRLLTASLEVQLPDLQQVILAGEPLYGQDVLNWYKVQGEKTQLANMYGLTETTVLKSYYRITPSEWSPGEVIPVGKPISNTKIAVINEGGMCLHGELGEVYIKSPYATLGYLDTDLNERLFVQNPLSSEKDIICRTGDIGRFNSSGDLEILGREDDQVKIHGVRIELTEVRNALYELVGIERVELVVHQAEDNNSELLCYYTGDAQGTGHLREALGEFLPSVYLPSHFLWLESFPLTLNGKVDRKKLPRPDLLLATESFEAPEGELEIRLARLWSKVLGRDEIGRQDSFFNLGGSSLKVIKLISWIYKEYEVQLTIGDVFDNPEFSSQAVLIRETSRTAYKAIDKIAEQDSYNLSPSQLRLWIQEQRDNDALPFNGLFLSRFTGELDYSSIERSFETMLERHESLRTVFVQEAGIPRQKIVSLESLGFKLEYHDLSDDTNPEAKAISTGLQERLKRFDLSEGPILRVGLFRLSESCHLLIMWSHHIITDEWSMQLQSRELIKLYNAYRRGEDNPLTPLRIQYKDYAAWMLSMLSGAELERHRSYWMEQFLDEVPSLSLPSDRPRPEVPTFRGAEYHFMLSVEQSDSLKNIIEKQGATLFMGLNALVVALLYRYTGNRDIVIGAPVAGRDHPDLEDQMGYYLNTLALRYCFEPDEDFSGLLTKVKERVLGGFEHQVYPFDYLISELGLDTDVNRSNLFDVAIILQNVDLNLSAKDLEVEGLEVEVLSEDISIAKGDIRFQFTEGEQGLNCSIEYTTDLYDEDRIKRIESDFIRLLDKILSDPNAPLSDLDYLSLEEQEAGQGFNQILHIENQTSVQSLLSDSLSAHQNLSAVVAGDTSISYNDLSSSSNRLSHLLLALNFKPGDVAGTLLPSGIDLVSSVLGIMHLGGVYMPMDDGYSDRRLTQMLEESGINVLITTAAERLYVEGLLKKCDHSVKHLVLYPDEVSELMEGLNVQGLDLIGASSANVEVVSVEKGRYIQLDLSLEDQPASDPEVEVGFDSPGYIYYTSGSSGRSKGIKGSYQSLSHYVQWHAKEWGLGEESRVAQLCSPGFDAWLKDVLPTLISGGTVWITPNDIRSNTGLLSEWLIDSGVTHLQTVPSIFRLLTASLEVQLPDLQQVVLAGEPLYGQDVLNWYKVQGEKTQLANMYGLTETTVLKSYYRIAPSEWSLGEIIPVGKPISNTKIAVINEGGMCLHGELGEVYIKSPYATLGYLDTDLNERLFVQNPLSSEKDIICRTGDIGRFNSSGDLEILGREDDQVKIHGVRIELTEVRNALYELVGIERVELVVHQAEDNNRELLCYYTGDTQETGDLREVLGELLPSVYLPSHFLWLESFPLTLNGKVDRKKLPRPDLLLATESFEAPQGELEIRLARLWSEVLGRDEIGRQDSFFNLGGSSLKVIKLISWVYKEYEVQLTIGDVFDNPEFSSQAVLIRETSRTAYKAIDKIAEQDSYDLSPSQLRLWIQEQRDNDALPFNGLFLSRFTGELDYSSIERSFETMLERHESLRTVFVQEAGIPRQKIVSLESLGFKLEYHDLSDDTNPEAKAISTGLQERLKRFDLSEGPILRVGLFRLSENCHLLIMWSHHIITDEWSMQLQSRELIKLYNAYRRGEDNPLTPLRIQYKDYAAWMLSMLSGAELERHRSYWMEQFSDEVPSLSLPSDRPRPEVPTFRGAEYHFMLSVEQSDSLKNIIEKQGATLFMGLNALVVALLYRYTGNRDIVIGTPVAGRDHPDLEDQMGYYLNTLALRYCFEPDEDFSGLLTKVKERVLGGFEHQVYPFDYLISELGLDTEANRSNLFDVALVLQNIDVNLSAKDLEMQGLEVEVLSEDISIAKGDMRFQFVELEQGLKCSIEYTTDLYDEDRIKRMESDFTRLLDAILSDPSVPLSDLDYLSLEEQEAGQGFNQVLHIEEQASVSSLLKDSFSAHQNLAAVVAGDKSISYSDLSSSSNRLSHLLLALNFKSGDVVGTLLPSGIDLVSSVLGIMHLGGVYMPMDDGYSDRRLTQMLEESGISVLITTSAERLYVEGLLEKCDHSVKHLVLYPDEVSELMEGLHVEGLDLIDVSSTDVEVLSIEEGRYVERDLSLEDQPAIDPEVEVGFDSPGYIYYTSGSSGRSKGIKGSYQSLSHYVQWHAKEWGLGEESRVAQLCSPGFDAWLKDVLPTLISGGTVWITPNDIRSNTGLLSEWLIDYGITHLQTVPSIFRLLTASLEVQLPDLQQVVLAGEPLYGQDVLNWYKVQGEKTQLANMYGLTETTVLKSYYRITPSEWSPGEVISVGKPISNTIIAVINEGGMCLHGELGEVYIKSPYTTLGYLDTDLNERLFVQNPLSSEKDIICRTGDIGRFNSSGDLEILGREDDQVKIHGVRVELTEVRNALYELAGIERVELIVHQAEDNNSELLCYYTGDTQDTGDLREALGELLPSVYLPSHFLWLESFPLTLNGKVDRKKLPRLDVLLEPESFEAPEGDLEIGLARLWGQVLDRNEISRQDSFFNLGGSSLKVIQLISWIYKEYEVQLSIGDIFSSPQLSSQAELIQGASRTTFESIEKATEKEYYALSNAQQRLWIIDQINPNQIAYNMSQAVRLEGHLDQDLLYQTFEKLIERHETLRTSFHLHGEKVVQYISEKVEFEIEQYTSDEQQVEVVINEFIKPFDFSNNSLLKVGLIKINPTNHMLMVDMPHIICDGISMDTLINEFKALYNDQKLPVSNLQYKDYAEWQHSESQQEEIKQHKDFWLEEFAGEITPLQLPVDFVRPVTKNFSGDSIGFELSQEEYEQLKTICNKEGVTLFMMTFALFSILLSKLGDTEDLVIGTPTAGRAHPDLENLIGMFVNTLGLRNYPKGEMSFKEYLSDVKSRVLACFENEMYPYEELINDLQVERDTSHNPLFDVMFTHIKLELTDTEIPGLTLKSYGNDKGSSKFDLSLIVTENDENVSFTFEYSTELFERKTAERIQSYFLKIMKELMIEPETKLSSIDIISEEEKHQILYEFNTPEINISDKNVISLYEKQVDKTPNAIALIYQQTEMSYQDLNDKSNLLARHIKDKGVSLGALIPICIERGPEMIIGILAILKAGAAYVPIDPNYPQELISYVLKDTATTLLVTNMETSLKLDLEKSINPLIIEECLASNGAEKTKNLKCDIKPSDLAYIIYTSGSTGRPKGVMVTHANLANYLINNKTKYINEDTSGCGTFMCKPYSFDGSITALFMPLLFGKPVVVPSREVINIFADENFQKYAPYDFLKITPSHLAVLETQKIDLNDSWLTRRLIIGGETWHPSQIDFLADMGLDLEIINHYGPTEATVGCATYSFRTSSNEGKLMRPIPIGKPIDNVQLYILNDALSLVPVGVSGELYIGGAGLAREYLNQKELTVERFISNPFSKLKGSKLYRTGDFARWGYDGNIEFIGRLDDQVKIRGFRIELGQIQQQILNHPDIKEVVVLSKELQEENHLVAYYVSEKLLEENEVRTYLSTKLPDYMIPSHCISIEQLPLTSTGKVDKRSLPHPEVKSAVDHVAPSTAIEVQLVAIWSEILKLEAQQISVTRSFFDLGGHSLRATFVVNSIEKEFGHKIPLQLFFRMPTVKEIADFIQNLSEEVTDIEFIESHEEFDF